MNVPFVPVRGLLGSDYMKIRPDFLSIANPYDPAEAIALVPAIAPDVAVFHGFQGDRYGNVIASGAHDAKLIVQASKRAVATVEEVVEGNLAEAPHTGVLVPGIHIDAVVHAPRGAHPTSCRGYYDIDADHVREYMQAARTEAEFQAYLDRYVFGVRDHAEYLERVTTAPAVAGATAVGEATFRPGWPA
jgi:glutaconate CoA-transferase, subunit A